MRSFCFYDPFPLQKETKMKCFVPSIRSFHPSTLLGDPKVLLQYKTLDNPPLIAEPIQVILVWAAISWCAEWAVGVGTVRALK